MAIDHQRTGTHTSARSPRARPRRLTGGGTSGNERLTATTGAALILLLAVIGVTLLRLRPLLSVHLFVGMLLIPPILLKLATTGYRFIRYYTHDRAYRSKGPPPTPLRMIAPMMVLSTAVVFASGVALLLVGPSSRDTLLPVHKVSFIIWSGFFALHVLGHIFELAPALRADYAPATGITSDVTGRTGRTLALAGTIVAGVVLAILVIPEFGPWLHNSNLFHEH